MPRAKELFRWAMAGRWLAAWAAVSGCAPQINFDAESGAEEGQAGNVVAGAGAQSVACAELQTVVLDALATHCYQCHGGNGLTSELGDITDLQAMVDRGAIVPGQSTESRLVQTMAPDDVNPMPPIGAGSVPAEQVTAVASWVDTCL